jgi:putative RecB family exonuclease
VGSLSPSRAGDFMTCPLLYRFRTIDRLPQAPSPAATRGTVVHAALEALFDLPAAERTLERAAALVSPAWDAVREAEPEVASMFADDTELNAWLASARELLEGYFSLEDPTRLEPSAREQVVEVLLPGGLRLRGIVDRIDVAPTGEVRVVDYKTGRAPGEMFEAKALFQMKFYALVLWRTRGTVPRLLQLMYLGDREVLRYSPDEADLLAVERKVLALWEAIERATQLREFRARRAGCATGATTRRCARPSAAPRPPSRRSCPGPTCCCPTSSGRRRRRRSAGADGTALPVQHSAMSVTEQPTATPASGASTAAAHADELVTGAVTEAPPAERGRRPRHRPAGAAAAAAPHVHLGGGRARAPQGQAGRGLPDVLQGRARRGASPGTSRRATPSSRTPTG